MFVPRDEVSDSSRMVFPVSSLNMASETKILTEYVEQKCVDTDLR